MDTEDFAADAALFARMRRMWDDVDPVPADLVDRMVAAVAVEDLTREYALLTLVEGAHAAVRGEADTATLQFSDGDTTVLLHVTVTEAGGRRVDGWVAPGPPPAAAGAAPGASVAGGPAAALAIRLVQEEREWAADPGEHGRFAFDDVTPGMARLRLVVRASDGALRDFQTPLFEV